MSFLVFLCAILKNVIYGLSVFFVGSLTDNVDVLDVLALRYIISFAALSLLRAFGIIKISVRFKDFFDRNSGVSDCKMPVSPTSRWASMMHRAGSCGIWIFRSARVNMWHSAVLPAAEKARS